MVSRDNTNIQQQQQHSSAAPACHQPEGRTAAKLTSTIPAKFPYKLFDLLAQASKNGFEDIVSWLPCGTAFKLHNQQAFQETIMPIYFPAMSRYKSFRRQLNLYGIHQRDGIERMLKKGVYSHQSLVRNQRHLCSLIERAAPSAKKGRQSSDEDDDMKELRVVIGGCEKERSCGPENCSLFVASSLIGSHDAIKADFRWSSSIEAFTGGKREGRPQSAAQNEYEESSVCGAKDYWKCNIQHVDQHDNNIVDVLNKRMSTKSQDYEDAPGRRYYSSESHLQLFGGCNSLSARISAGGSFSERDIENEIISTFQ